MVVLDAGADVATQASYLNGGLLCPSLTWPWCNPTVFGLLAKSIRQHVNGEQAALKVAPGAVLDPYLWRWAAHFTANAVSASSLTHNFAASFNLAAYSMECMQAHDELDDRRGRLDERQRHHDECDRQQCGRLVKHVAQRTREHQCNTDAVAHGVADAEERQPQGWASHSSRSQCPRSRTGAGAWSPCSRSRKPHQCRRPAPYTHEDKHRAGVEALVRVRFVGQAGSWLSRGRYFPPAHSQHVLQQEEERGVQAEE